MFNRGRYELGGGPSLVDAISWDASEDGYDVSTVPSMRMIVPLDDLDAARWINLTGASGHAYNDHYTDQTELWADGETLPWFFTREAIEDAGGDTLTLEPRRLVASGLAAGSSVGVTITSTRWSCASAGTASTTSSSYTSWTRSTRSAQRARARS